MRVAMFAPQREKCGIRDYTDCLLAALRAQPEIEDIRVIPTPSESQKRSVAAALRGYPAEEKRYRSLGAGMNAADVAHVQHQYFFFGGVGPHKNHARAFYAAVRVPLVLTVHEIALPDANSSSLNRRMLTLANRQNFLHPAICRYIVHTENDARALASLSIPQERIHRIVHGVPAAAPMPTAEEAKRAFDLTGKKVVTLFGFLAVKKGHRLALEAAASLPPDTLLLFAGDRHPDDTTDYVPKLKEEIAARGLAERVRITGYLPAEQIPVLMAATDVGLAPFTQSSGSGSLANLFAYGRAVLASDIAPHKEIAREPTSPLRLFRSGDAADLTTQLRGLLENDVKRPALQQSALAYAERHSYAAMAEETVKVYQAARESVS